MADDGARDLLLPGQGIQAGDGNLKTASRLTTFGVDRNFANVLNMAFGFLLVFTAFQTTQMLAASLLGDLGTISVGIIYVVFTLGGFFAPAICRIVGPRMGMFLGALCYTTYVASLIYMIVPVVIVTSALIGCGAAVLWTSQGMMMSECTTAINKTKYNSLFWGIFNLCVLPGNIAGHFILLSSENKVTNTTVSTDPFKPMVRGWSNQNSGLFVLLTISAGLGSAGFLLLRKADPSRGTPASLDTRSVKAQIWGTMMVTLLPKMICLIPLFTFTGVAMTMWASWFTRQMYKTNIGLVMCAFGIAEFIGGFTIGRFVESYGRSPGLAFGTTCLIGAFLLMYTGNSDMSDFCGKQHPETVSDGGSAKPCKEFDAYGPFYIAAALYGFMDCTFQSIAAAICAKSFNATGNTPDAWALFRTFQALGAAVCFFISSSLVVKGETYASKQQLLVEIIITAIMGYAALFGHWMFCKYPQGESGVESARAVAKDDGVQYSQAIVQNGVVSTSACLGIGGPEQSYVQATHAFKSVAAVLEQAGSNCKQAIKVQIFTTAAADTKIVFDRYQDFFVHDGFPAPALTTATVSKLPGGAIVQVEATAVA